MKKFKGIKTLFDKHHKFERFGIVFACVVLAMSIIATTALVDKIHLDKNEMSSRVLYLSKFDTTLSNIGGQVQNLYTSKDKTRCFVVIKFDENSALSVDANRYKMYVTGATISGDNINLKDLQHPDLSGSIYSFGSSGYMGLYLVDANKFPSQLYDVTVTCDSKLGTAKGEIDVDSEEASAEDDEDVTGSWLDDYDHFEICFNPGASECKTAQFLSSDKWTIEQAYEECIARVREKTIRDQLDSTLTKLRDDLEAIEEYSDTCKRLGVVVPNMPKAIRGDKVENASSTATGDEANRLVYKPSYVYAGGYNFDWYAGSVKSGYFDSLRGNKTPEQYMLDKEKEIDDVDNAEPEWRMTSGELVDSLSDSINVNKTIKTAVTNLKAAWDTYAADKRSYQCKLLADLLYLELDILNLKIDTTTNFDKAVKVY